MKVSLFPNLSKDNAIQIATEAIKLLKLMGAEFVDFQTAAKTADFVLAIGGDGTILRCAKKLVGASCKIIGINTGFLGFMSTIESSNLSQMKRIFSDDYSISKRMMLDIKVIEEDGREFKYTALNDILIKRKDFKIWKFSVAADNQQVGKYRADGVLFSTPTGSTAHAFSAGGPILEPDCECMEMTLLEPFSIVNRPIIFTKDRVLEVKHKETGVYYSVDGEEPVEFSEKTAMFITASDCYANIVTFGDDCFHNTLNKKLMSSLKDR
jgi:NAD+ kinase